jgi:phage tail sheath protein FI
MMVNYGVHGVIEVKAARPITAKSSSYIGVVLPDSAMIDAVDSGNVSNGIAMTYYNNATEWKDALIAAGKVPADLSYKSAEAIALSNVSTKIIVVYVQEDTDAAKLKQNVIDGLAVLKSAPYDNRVLDKPDLIIVPEHSYDVDIAAVMDSVAARINRTAIVDVNAATEAVANDFIRNFGTRYCFFVLGRSVAEGSLFPSSAFIAGHIAYWDVGGSAGFDEYGYTKNHSNRIVRGVSGSERPIEYFDDGDHEALRLRNKGIASIVQDRGWRLYGFQTTDIDPVWKDLKRVRSFQRWLDAIINDTKWARDRNADELVSVKKSCNDFLAELKAANASLGYKIYLDAELCNVAAGEFVFVLEEEDMPAINSLTFKLTFVDDYNQVLIDYVNNA